MIASAARIDSILANQEKWLHISFGSPYHFPDEYEGKRLITESTISLVPEFQMGQKPYFSFSISKDLYSFARKGMWAGKNMSVGVEYNFQNKILAPKISYGGGALIFNYRLNALYYMTSEKKYPAFRPEIGVGLYRVQVSFGRNIFFKNMNLETINKWCISAYYYFPVLPRK